jgi:S-methylmethionine-dependent homocysteine/selenocysteine methylase
MPIILDGPMGTALLERGQLTPPPEWSALALRENPALVAALHRDYAAAGAQVHTANSFRTRRRSCPEDWERLARLAVQLCRASVGSGRVAGSMAPLEDCYRPDLSPAAPRPEHRELARVLADAGCDLLLCETFPHVGEALIAVEEAVATGVETWVSFTAGPSGDLLSPAQIRRGAAEAVSRGARAVLVNCVPASATLPFVEALAGLGVPFGAYANAGHPDEGMGWASPAPHPEAAARYRDLAQSWVDAGASLVGSCCGTDPATTAALVRAFALS